MAKLLWDQTGERLYETGDRNVALYVYNSTALEKTMSGEGASALKTTTNYYDPVAWNGITAMTETPSGAEPTDLWADDTKYATMRSAEQFGGTIEAYTYPDEWEQCDGSVTINGVTLGQQGRKAFGLAYVTTVGNDTELNDFGQKIHLVYNATANPSERSYATINDSPEAITFSWEYTTTPIDCKVGTTEYKKVACLTLDYRKLCMTRSQTGSGWTPDTTKIEKWEAFKEILFGSETANGYLPMPADVIAFFA